MWGKHGFSAEHKGFERLAVSKATPSIYVPRDVKNDSRQIQGFETTRNTNHRFAATTPQQPDLQDHDLDDAPSLKIQ